MTDTKKVAVLLSGGMDSTTALAQALNDGASSVVAVSFTYGSRHQRMELEAAQNVVAWYRGLEGQAASIDHLVVPLPDIFHGAGSSLMGEVEVPKEAYKDPTVEGPSNTEVPFRNANLIAAATTIAMTHKCSALYIAVHASDANHWAYPDCTPEFIGAMAAAIYVGSMHRVRLIAPFQNMTKSDVVTRAALLDAPLDLTWSCYQGGTLHCGVCPTCVERIEAFQAAGFADPVGYLRHITWSGYEGWPTVDPEIYDE